MAAALVEQFTGDFHPEEYEDDYQRELRILIEEKLEKGEVLDPEATFGKAAEEETGGDVVDLMEALKRSLEAKRAKATTTAEPEPERKPARKKKGA